MFKFFRRHRTLVLVALAACVGGLVLFGAGGSSFMASPQDTIVKVNGRALKADQFDRIYRMMSRQQADTSPAAQQQLMGQALNEMIRQEVLSDEAKRYGLTVTDEELALQLASIPAFQREGRFDPATYDQVVRRTFGTPPHEFEKNHRKDLLVRKLNLLIASSVQVSDAEVKEQGAAILEAEKDPKVRKELASDAAKMRERVREREINLVFNDWLNRMNSELKVSIVSDRFRQRLGGPAAPPANAPK
jgi:parvulin-like peptidyl-prolyl isomerase